MSYWLESSGAARPVMARWWIYLVLGAATVMLGLVLLFDLVAAVETLAAFVALSLMLTGVGEFVSSYRYGSTIGIASAIVLIVAGAVAAAWPGVTLWALALIAAAGLILSGTARVVVGVTEKPSGSGWLVAAGVLYIMAGALAVVWPDVTVTVLAILLGICLVFYGTMEIALSMALRDLHDNR